MPRVELIIELLTTFIGNNTKCKRKNANSKIIDSWNSKPCKLRLLDVEYVILIQYYYQPANGRAVYQSIDGPTGQQADNSPNSDRLGEVHQTVLQSTVWVYCWFGQRIWPWSRFRPDPVMKWWYDTVAISRYTVYFLYWDDIYRRCALSNIFFRLLCSSQLSLSLRIPRW